MEKISDNWLFTPSWDEGFKKAEKVRLPHTVSETPLHYADSNDYQMVSGYRRTLVLNEEDKTKRLFLLFEGAAHILVELRIIPAAEHMNQRFIGE